MHFITGADTVNGTYPSLGLSEQYVVNGDVIVWHYTDDYTQEKSGLSQNQTETTKELAVYTSVSGGRASGSMSYQNISDALTSVLEARANGNYTQTGELIMDMTTLSSVSSSSLSLPVSSAREVANAGVKLTIETNNGTFSFDSAALSAAASSVSSTATMTFSVEKLSNTSLSNADRELVGDNPVYDINLSAGGYTITNFGSGMVTVVLPYTPRIGENTSNTTVYYLAGNGTVKAMTGAYYSAALGGFVFTTNHFSKFAIIPKTTADNNSSDGVLWSNPFYDVSSSDWFFDAVKYANMNGLMSGTSTYEFSPNTSLTRAMLVTILYRYAGQPAVAGGVPFTDVGNGQWYTNAIMWANATGIVTGYGNGKFGTNDEITREQLATILYRYSQKNGLSTYRTASLSGYIDAAHISGYAQVAMSWANAEGLITGRTVTTLVPTGTATRADAATILMRFIENIAKV